MGIQALPQTTVRTLGAQQTLTDPAVVVKELLDNALDAHASSVAIEIHSNTLETIQVRDNGHGIPPEDRPLVARPHCTSKIRSEDDLREIGGSSLGFRGEALASVAEMGGSLTISTRIEGEQVATLMKISPQGEVIGQDRASTPVGTTVKITDFMNSNPVRKQIALKSTEKTLKKIKQLLQAYAFARPQVRLSLRVLKAKNDKGNWMYAPKAGGNAEDTAFKVVGAACASQCTWSVIEEHGFNLQAFLPRLDADSGKVSNSGAFVSVDGRPLNVSRGTAKQILKHFKGSLKAAGSPLQDSKDVFIYLEIQCPTGSYDANVEPAKDEVLFEDNDAVIAAAKNLFAVVYHPSVAADLPREDPDSPLAAQRPAEDDRSLFDRTGLRPRTTRPETPTCLITEHSNVNIDPARSSSFAGFADVSSENRPMFRSTMYGCDEEDLGTLDSRPMIDDADAEAEAEELRRARQDVTVSNPWVTAKMNASRRRPVVMDDSDTGEVIIQSTPRIDSHTNMLPTPRPSSPSPPSDEISPGHLSNELFANDGRIIGLRDLPAPVEYAQRPLQSDAGIDIPPSFSPARRPPVYDYSLPQPEPAGTPLSAIPQARISPQKRMQQGKLNKPFKPPARDQPEREKVWFDHLENLDQPRRPPKGRRGNFPTNGTGLVTQGELGDLLDDPRPLTPPRRNRDMRDFVTPVERTDHSVAALIERRNYPAPRRAGSLGQGRLVVLEDGCERIDPVAGFVRASDFAAIAAKENGLDMSPKRPFKRRRTTDSRPLRELSGNVPLRDRDDEGYQPNAEDATTPRQRKGSAGRKMTRRKSSRLPLERTPAGKGTHFLSTTVRATTARITTLAKSPAACLSLLNWDEPSLDAYDVFATVKDPHEMTWTADTLKELLINRVCDREMVQDLRELVPTAFAAHQNGDAEVELA